MIKIAFDVDGTLIKQNRDGLDIPHYKVIYLLRLLREILDVDSIYIWSGSGFDYAKRWKEKLDLPGHVIVKGSIPVDIAFDDEEVNLGKVNIKV